MTTKVNNRMIDGSAVNVLDYGAVGDGVTDDYAAIQAALDAGAERDVKVILPEGTFAINRGLKIVDDGAHFEGLGGTIIKGDSFVPEDDGYSALIRILAADRSSNVSITVSVKGIHLDGVDNSVNGIIGTGVVRGSLFQELVIDNMDDGIHFNDSWSFGMRDININNCSEAGITLGGAKYGEYIGSNVVNNVSVLSCIARNCGRSGLYLANGSNNSIMASTFELNTINAEIRTTHACIIQGCYFEAQTGSYNVQIGRTVGQGSALTQDLSFFGNYLYQTNEEGQVWLFGCDDSFFFSNFEITADGDAAPFFRSSGDAVSCEGNTIKNGYVAASVSKYTNTYDTNYDGAALPQVATRYEDSVNSSYSTEERGKVTVPAATTTRIHNGGVLSTLKVMGQNDNDGTNSFVDEVHYVSFGAISNNQLVARGSQPTRTYSLDSSTNLALTIGGSDDWTIQVVGETFR